MKLHRLLSTLLSAVLCTVSILPIPSAYAAASFENTSAYIWTRNVSKGESSFQTSTSADPGDELDFFAAVKNSGVDTATESVLEITLPDITFAYPTAFAGWSTATYLLNSNKGEIIFSPHYIDSDSSGSISAGDIRVNRYGIDETSSTGKYLEGSTVAGGDYDDGDDLSSSVVSNFYITGGDSTWSSGEIVYIKGDGNNTTTSVEIDDVRVTSNGSYLAGSIVVSGDTDICTTCLSQADNIYRLDDGNDGNDTIWPFDEGGFPIGDLGANKPFYITVYDVTVDASASAVLTPTFTSGATNTSPATTQKSCTINVDTTPSVSSITFTPGVLKNDGVATTKVEVVATDKNGSGDIKSVSIDLSTIGGNASTTLYDDGTNGDTTASDGTWSLSGITSSAAAATYIALTATATDFDDQTATKDGSIIIQDSTAATVTINSTTPTTIGSTGDVTLNWQADEGIWLYELRLGSCSGSVATGTNVSLGDGSAEILATNTAVNSVLDNSNFSAGDTDLYVCATDSDSNVGSNFSTITKDLTAPTVIASSLSPATITTGGTSTIAWSANEAGTYSVRVGSCAGSLITGTNASGSYAGSGSVDSIINASDVAEGTNTIYVCLTDAVNNTGSDNGTIIKDTTPPDAVSGVTLADNDTTNDGVDGLDFSVGWTPASNDTSFSYYRVYLLPDGTAFDANTHTSLKSVTGQSSNSWTGDATNTVDSAGNALAAGDYIAYIIAVDTNLLTSSEAAASAATITLDDLSPPTLDSAATFDTDTLKLTFNEDISFVDTAKISATGVTVDAAYNSDGFTNGVKINGSDAREVFIRISTVATDFTAADLALAACAVRDVTGLSDLNEAGNCTDLAPVTNANAAVSGVAISDGVGPTLTLTSPATDGTDNATVAVDYTLSETAGTNDIELKFTATGGNADANAPHTIVVDDSLVGSDAESSGNHTFTLDASSFTSLENGASDTLVDGAIYTVELSADDAANNAATPVESTGWTYDTTAPTAPVATQNFSSPTADDTPEFNWSTVSDAVSYRVEVSLQSTNYSPSFATQSVNAPTTNWTLNPAFASDGTQDDTYVWRVYATDTAGNESSASNQMTFILNTQTDTPTVVLADQTNSSQSATDSQTVNATIDAYTDDVTHYILSETQSTQPAVGSGDWTAIPGTAPQTVAFTFANATEEAKTVYVWVKDNLDNISTDVSSASITLDSSVPTQPSLTTEDADNGADTGKTNNATITIDITSSGDSAKWCVLSDDVADGAPADPSESSCTAPAGGAATGWSSSKPTSHTLASTGDKNVYVWTQDTAGNVSSASAASNIDYSDSIPPDPTLTLTDQSSGDSNYTNSTTVNVGASNAGTIWEWIIDTASSGKPSENSLSWGAQPATLTLPSGDGSKTAYAWVKDVYGNISANQVTAGIYLDETNPTISAQKTLDLDGDSQIDAVQITMQEQILDSTIVRTDFSLSGAYTFENRTGVTGTTNFTNGIATGSTADDEIFYLAVTESGGTDTGTTPDLTYTAGSLTDKAQNSLQTVTVTLTDGVSPIISTINLLDGDSDGDIDTARVTMSENVSDATITASQFLIGGNNGNSVSSGTANDNVFDITITNEVAGSILADVTYTPGSLTDTTGNLALEVTSGDITEIDSVGPAIISASYSENGAGVADDTLTITFSESIDDSSLALTDFTVSSGGSLGAGSTIATGTADDEQITITLDGVGASALTAGTSAVAFSGTGVVDDAVNDADGNTSNSQTAAVTTNGAVVINEIMWGGTATSTADEYIELRNMSSSVVDIANWVIENAGAGGTDLTIPGGSTIAANGYFLIANYAETDGSSALNVTPDWVTTTIELDDAANGDLVLKDDSAVTIDSAEGDTWPFGSTGANYISMERDEAPGNGLTAGSWHNAVDSQNFDNTNQKGTPKLSNVVDNQAPIFDGGSYLPDHQTLLPASPMRVAVSYADDVGGVGVDTASVTFTINSTNCASLNATTTQAVCDLSAVTLSAGKNTVAVTVDDLAGNSNSTSWDFWVDDLSFTIEQKTATLGLIQPNFPGYTDDNALHTKITVKTYGAGFTVSGSPQSAMTTGAVNIPWHTNNTSTAGTGAAWRVKEGAAGSFGNYFNFNDATQVATKTQLTGTQLAAANALQTYTFYVQNYAGVDAVQTTGYYSQNVDYTANFSY